ncbi:TFIIB-type zinc ribbon-containing protein [Pyrobaculum islandicum]|nr:TFIIB-type zinc ribbon-containing protein [Pyrobaculum islandicum]
MICPYCSSGKIVLQSGEYVCRECGTVVGWRRPELRRRVAALLRGADRRS